jgi:prepilin peptidase CpaA
MNLSFANISLSIPAVTATAILVAGVVDDFRSRKFHNELFLACVALAAISVLIVGGVQAFPIALLGLLAGVAVFLPLVLMKIIGAGDMKLMAAFGLAAGWDAVLHVALYGLIWGALFGVLATVFRGEGRTLAYNMVSIVTFRERKGLVLHKIPFTIAILMGWLSVLTMRGVA